MLLLTSLRRARRSRAWSWALVVCLLVAACGSDDSPASGNAARTDDDSSDESSLDPGVTFPLEVEHAAGTTTIAAAPQRVAALDLSSVDAVLALDLDLVGYTTYADPEGPLPDHFGAALTDHANEAAWVGDLTAPNLELLATLQPDLIVTAAVRHEEVYDQLSAIAPTVMTESAGGGWKDGFRLIAAATGRSARAEALIGPYEERAATIGTAINDTAGNPTISVVRFLDAIRLYQPVSFSGTVLADAGLARPPSQQDTEDFITVISEEALDTADADVLFFSVYDNVDVADYVEELQRRPLWQQLGAVQNERAIPVADATWMSGVGIFGAHEVLNDLAETFGVETHPVPQEDRP